MPTATKPISSAPATSAYFISPLFPYAPVNYRNSALFKINQMGQHRPTGRAMQPGVEPLIHLQHHCWNMALASLQQVQYLALAAPAVANHPTDQLPGIGDSRAMRRIIHVVVAVIQFLQACHISRHIAIGWADHAG
jgi:hypothetical protein